MLKIDLKKKASITTTLITRITKIINQDSMPILTVGLVVILLSILQISGSSIGIYSHYFGNEQQHSGQIYGKPNPLRSDEWLVNSQMLIAQHNADYPYINNNIGNGQNMSLVIDVPYKEWSVVFKPQNLVFFVSPFSFAFAFKWWFVLFILFIGAYLFSLELLPKKRLISSLLALILCLSPFIQWWLTPGTTMTLGLSLLIAVILLKIHKIKPNITRKKIAYSLLLTYLFVCFAFLLYPPFQIPCILAIGVFYISTLYKYRHERHTWTSLLLIVGSALVALVIVALYILTRMDAVSALLGTSYPGARVIESGGISIVHILANFLGPLLQSAPSAMLYTDNQSESSNFALPFVTIIILSGFAVVMSYRRKDYRSSIALGSLLALFFIFLARMTLPFADSIYRLIFLGSIPNLRLIIGLGIIAFILLVLNISYLQKSTNKLDTNQRWIITITCCLIYSAILFSVYGKAPGFIPSTTIALALLITYTLFTWLLVNKKNIAALALLLVFSAFSINNIHPLYRGVDTLTENPLSQFIKQANKPGTTWIVSDTIQLENFASMNGAHSLSGVFVLPQTKLFKQLPSSDGYATTNRYAHVLYDVNNTNIRENIELLQADMFKVNINPCGNFIKQNNITHVIATKPIESSCVTLVYRLETHKVDPGSISVYEIK